MRAWHVTCHTALYSILENGLQSIYELEEWGDDYVWLFTDYADAVDRAPSFRGAPVIIEVDITGLETKPDPHTHADGECVHPGYESAVVVTGSIPPERLGSHELCELPGR